MGNDQERPAAYTMDAVVNGNWIVQRDVSGDIASKPPMFPWLAGLATVALGRNSLFSLYLPTGLATLATALLLAAAGTRWGGWRTGLFAGLAWVLSPAGMKVAALARTDALFVFFVAVTALLGFGAWNRGRGWIGFWLAGVAATLTKGPLGLVLGAGGLLAYVWERRSGGASKIRGQPWLGLGLYLVLCGGWFALACWVEPEAVYRKMIVRELVGHATGSDVGTLPLAGLPLPFLYFLGRFAPWSASLSGDLESLEASDGGPRRETVRALCDLLVCGRNRGVLGGGTPAW